MVEALLWPSDTLMVRSYNGVVSASSLPANRIIPSNGLTENASPILPSEKQQEKRKIQTKCFTGLVPVSDGCGILNENWIPSSSPLPRTQQSSHTCTQTHIQSHIYTVHQAVIWNAKPFFYFFFSSANFFFQKQGDNFNHLTAFIL